MAVNRKRISSSQLSFHFGHDREFLVRTFEKTAGTAVTLVLTDNASSMLSVRRKGPVSFVRLHRIFLCADEGTLKEIASFIRHGRGSMPMFRAFVNQMSAAIRRKLPKSFPVRTLGKYHDLRSIFERLNREYFAGKLTSVITWGTGSSGRTVRKRTLGSYSYLTDTIRINPVLDKNTVPAYYIEFVVYHEMLHSSMGIQKKNNRRAIHTRDFREREQVFKEYDKAIQWEKTGKYFTS
jgi:predicted SprT family Zn-dependent metalloprotease